MMYILLNPSSKYSTKILNPLVVSVGRNFTLKTVGRKLVLFKFRLLSNNHQNYSIRHPWNFAFNRSRVLFYFAFNIRRFLTNYISHLWKFGFKKSRVLSQALSFHSHCVLLVTFGFCLLLVVLSWQFLL